MPESWARFCSLIRARPRHQLAKNELLDIFNNGQTVEYRTCRGHEEKIKLFPTRTPKI